MKKITKEQFIEKSINKLKNDVKTEDWIRQCINENMNWVDEDYNSYLEDPSTKHENYWISCLCGKLALEI